MVSPRVPLTPEKNTCKLHLIQQNSTFFVDVDTNAYTVSTLLKSKCIKAWPSYDSTHPVLPLDQMLLCGLVALELLSDLSALEDPWDHQGLFHLTKRSIKVTVFKCMLTLGNVKLNVMYLLVL